MENLRSPADWHAELAARARMPAGFRFAGTELEFYPAERPGDKPYHMKLSLLLADEPTEAFAATFTRNAFPGHPVTLGRERVRHRRMQGVLVNNKIANVGAAGGLQHAIDLTAKAGALLGIDGENLFMASTGIIGWALPVQAMEKALPALVSRLGQDGPVDFARAIMTTDRWPKLRCETLGGGSILAFAKGAGMIEPNMATMLVFIITDIAIDPAVLKALLPRVVDRSFNCITVDSDQSTSDTCLLFSSAKVDGVDSSAFEAALTRVCTELSEDIVRNGEGTGHVIRCTARGFGSNGRDVAKAVVNSPLVKTAIYGNDPNVGRIVAAIGDWLGNAGLLLDTSKLQVRLQNTEVFSDGAFRLDGSTEKAVSDALVAAAQDPSHKGYPLHERTVDIDLILAGDDQEVTVYGSDLGYEYVRENADYRS